MNKRLTRNTRNSILGGVASGFGAYLDVDPVLIRLVFIVLTLVGGAGVLAYVAAWIIMPVDDAPPRAHGAAAGGAAAAATATAHTAAATSAATAGPESGATDADAQSESGEPDAATTATGVPPGDRFVAEMREAGERVVRNLRESSGDRSRGRLIAGLVLIVFGLVLLADQFFPLYWLRLGRLWPVALIVIGILILTRSRGEHDG